MGKISVVISAYNEERNIKDCLESVKDFTDEIIVIDNNSSDKTSEIAKKYTKKIFTQENDPLKIDLQKNFGFSKATNDWILCIDADERVTPELIDEINSVVDSERAVGYWIPRKNMIFGKWIKSDMWWPDYQLRLFKKGKGKFEKSTVHKALIIDGVTEKIDNFLIHQNYTSVSQFVTRLNNYTDLEAENRSSDGYRFNAFDAIRFPVDDFVKTYFLQKGYMDGLHGLVLSILQAFYMEVVFAKLWEKKDFEDVSESSFTKEVQKELVTSGNKIKYWVTTVSIDKSKNPVKKIMLKTSRKITSSKIKG